ncbi:hypothetical protein CDAR_184571 [Caerostris darwini]|uniref:CRAL-TRIO domain-containing protein n=1 Tax=Caerostris darwini TaxID=1538125 RepID=A0AAV4RL22_9ARAC|nr:hypothetical protein CDAR_184571 [Caerostris darwini]
MLIVRDNALPHDLLIESSLLDREDISFARIGNKFHVCYAEVNPFVNMECEKNSDVREVKISNKMIFHKTPETLLNYFPKAVLPKQYGGDLESYDMAEWLKKAMAPEKLATLGGRPRQKND